MYASDFLTCVLRSSLNIAPLSSTPLWARDFASSEELIREFCRECRIVRKGLDGDLKKAMKDGKPVIIEGLHLDPSIYLMNEESGGFGSGVVQMKALPSAADTVTVAGIEKDGATSDAVMNKEISKEPIKWTPPKCIFVPIVLKMADVDHRVFDMATRLRFNPSNNLAGGMDFCTCSRYRNQCFKRGQRGSD